MPLPFITRFDVRHRARRYRARVDPGGIEWMCARLEAGAVAVDAGAYKGGYTYWMRERVGRGGHVFSFEPQPVMAAYLRRAVRAFDWDNVHVEEAALSSTPGRSTLHAPGDRPSQDASLVDAGADSATVSRYEVRLEALDRFFERNPSPGRIRLIKCDVEGHELDVFRGAQGTITRDRPFLLFECEARHDPSRPVDEVFRFVESLGYRGSFFWNGERRDLSEFRVDEHQVLGRAPYANNFAFEPLG